MEKITNLGPYRLHARVSAGGMAEVYLATIDDAAGGDRFMAVKRILPELTDETEFVGMFIDEARLVSQLHHPGIAGVYDLGRDNGELYLVMEYVSGRDVATIMKKLRAAKRRLPPEFAVSILASALEALGFAHEARDATGRPLKLVHRDVSPSNLLVSYEGDVKLIDFGVASAANRLTRTATGMLKGKYRYMSPEQASAMPLDSRSDIYAAGVVCYELVTGEKMYAGDSDLVILKKVGVGEVPKLQGHPAFPDDLARLVSRALTVNPADRYQTATEFAIALREWAAAGLGKQVSREELRAFMHELFAQELKQEVELIDKARLSLAGGAPAPGGVGHVAPASATLNVASVDLPADAAVGARRRATLGMVLAIGALVGVFSAGLSASRQSEVAATPVAAAPKQPAAPTMPTPAAAPVVAATATAAVPATAAALATAAAPVPVPAKAATAQPAPTPAPSPPHSEPSRAAPTAPKAPKSAAVAGPSGLLRVSAFPPGRVFVDGMSLERTTPVLDYEIGVGSHLVHVVAADGRRGEARVEVIEGKPTTAYVKYP